MGGERFQILRSFISAPVQVCTPSERRGSRFAILQDWVMRVWKEGQGGLQPYCSRTSRLLAKERPHALSLRDSGWSILGRVLCPFRHLAQADAVFGRIAQDGQTVNSVIAEG